MDPNTELLILVHPSYPWLEETTMRGGRKKALHFKLSAIVRAANFYTPKNTYVVGPLLDDTKDLATCTPENYETLLDLARTNQYLTGGIHAIGLFTAVEDPAMQAQRENKSIRIGGFYSELCCASYALFVETFTANSYRTIVPIIDHSLSHWSP
jgi:hypothetical protein